MLEWIQTNWGLLATILLAISELLAVLPFFKSNSIAQLILNTIKSLLGKKDAA